MARFQKPWARLIVCADGIARRIMPPKTTKELSDVLHIRSRYEDRGYSTPCRVWVGCKDSCGYGVLRYLGKNTKTQRLAWLVKTGKFPKVGFEVCHKCDNPSCIEPSHLFIGSHLENMIDANKKGRLRKVVGVNHYCCSFTESQVRELRVRFLTSPNVTKEMASAYKVSVAALKKIRDFKSWKHVKILDAKN